MKKVILLALFIPFPALGQIYETFESETVSNWVQSIEGRWKADATLNLSGNFSLHHIFDNPDAGIDQIGIPLKNLHPAQDITRWSFLVKHGYDPSSQNNWAVFLMSDNGPASMLTDGSTSGYAVGVNLIGSDDTIRLWKIDGNKVTTVIDSHINWQTVIGMVNTTSIVVERSKDGNWFLSVSKIDGTFIGNASGSDKQLFNQSWLGIYYKYSSTRDRLLWIDDVKVEGSFYEDPEPPPARACAGRGDVIISEIMADPLPAVSLAPKEYIEIINRTGFSFNLKNWNLTIGDYPVSFPAYIIPPSGIFILCDEKDTLLFQPSGNVIGIKQLPILNDEGGLIFITDSAGVLIHGIEYSHNWYNDELKSDGGWSLEIKDTDFPFYGSENWKASVSEKGGTPGAVNSVSGSNPDTSFYGILDVFPTDSVTLLLKFSEPVFSLSEDFGKIHIPGNEISGIFRTDPLFRSYTIKLRDTLQRGKIYSIETPGLSDFAGNPIGKYLMEFDLPLLGHGQIYENFESQNITNWIQSEEGRWKADATLSLSGSFSLHHIFDNPDAGADQIGIPLKNLHPSQELTRWSFLVKHGYDPSSQNNWAVFLMSDNGPGFMSTDGGTRGYAIGVNLIGSDDTLRLWKIDGTKITTVIDSHVNWQTGIGAANTARIVVERSKDGVWSLSISTIEGTQAGNSSGSDNQLFNQSWFGICYKYSSTRDRLLWLDDIKIEGCFFEDKEPPQITTCDVKGKKLLKVGLSEEQAEGVMVVENFSVNSQENLATSLKMISKLTFEIQFENEFINKSSNTLNIGKLCDMSGNISTNLKSEFMPVWAETGDIAVTEIMADPLPVVSLPDREYLEITNRTIYPFNLKNWILTVGNDSVRFPESIIPPSGLSILCDVSDTSHFRKYGSVIGLKQFPVLTDEGKLVFISDSTGHFIHGIEYSSDWYNEELKSDGGWSLEMKDINYPFYGAPNWNVSVSKKGGTPGSLNSVSESNPDNSFYGILNVFPVDSVTVLIRFSEPVFHLTETVENIKIGYKEIIDILPADPLFRTFCIKLQDPIGRGRTYTTETPGLSDFAGNPIDKYSIEFGLPETAEQGDILFNEVLFNPLPGDPDYLELYNCSAKTLDASRLQLVSINDSGERSDFVPASDEAKCILPGDYYAITTDREKIFSRYFSADPNHLHEIGSLPAMNDNKGHLILYSRELEKIDELVYIKEMHYKLLTVYDGISLEKINPRLKSEETANWHSATESSGWGTPGAANSVFDDLQSEGERVIFSSTKITPDNDGYEDFLTIKLSLNGNGNVISVMVFDESGSFVRKLVSNQLAGPDATILWDGTADDGSAVDTGIYIILITLYDDTGKTEKWKKVCTVIR
jgi:hypothetical protein